MANILMTREKRVLLSPLDILGIGFECPHCGTTYLVPIENLDRGLPTKCHNCHEIFVDNTSAKASGPIDTQALAGFVGYFKELRKRKFGACLRLEIEGCGSCKDKENP